MLSSYMKRIILGNKINVSWSSKLHPILNPWQIAKSNACYLEVLLEYWRINFSEGESMSSRTSIGYYMSKLCQVINLLRPRFLYNVVLLGNSAFLTKAQLHLDLLLSSKCWLLPRHELSILSHNHWPIYRVAMLEASKGPSLCSEQAFLLLLQKNCHQKELFFYQEFT